MGAPAKEKEPAGQGEHWAEPGTSLCWPAAQGRQAVFPVVSVYSPRGHAAQEGEPSSWAYSPAGQISQVSAGESTAGAVPDEQAMHSSAASPATDPGAHGVHMALPTSGA